MELTREQIKQGLDKAYKEAGSNAYFGNGFEAGVKFAQDIMNSSLTEDIYVSHSNDGSDDVYCAFADHARGLKDCEESGTLLTHIILHKGAKML